MGAMAITIVAGSMIVSLDAASSPMVYATQELISGVSVIMWCFATALIPALLAIYNDLKVTPTFLLGMRVEALPPEKRPDACIGCGACMSICPQNINIPEALADMAQILKGLPSWEAICREREAAAKKK